MQNLAINISFLFSDDADVFNITANLTSEIDTDEGQFFYQATSTANDLVTGNWSQEELLYKLKNPAIGVLLAIFSLIVVVGNLMVIVAVYREVYLRMVTNYFIVSLAIADVMVGGVVMPFSISNELTTSVWLYGQAWCDMWRSLDVLASTASILNLCVISLDRYWAITDPIAYPSKMSNSKVCILIALVWFCSAGISFPAIAWWRAVTPSDLPKHRCLFTEDSAYLIISSVVSFYVPCIIMMFVYCKIYRAALTQIEGIKSGCKVTADCPRGDNGEVMTLRIHRGGYHLRTELSGFERGVSDSDTDSPLGSRHHMYHHNAHPNHLRSTTFITKKIRHFAISKKLTKLAKEQKAAKTLGIVVGVFIICWVPFFCANVLYGICHSNCVYRPELLFPVFTWLGYINSGMNPIIYALSMKDFRRAFSKMILCCPRYRYSQSKRQTYNNQTNSSSTSSFSVNCTDRCMSLQI
ncbi:dopamine receptor 2 [Biomphalaria pfeifferi]|uniref:Dopamine receptor 2 n=1 Tax=Biomphalaria pfeifferi TaxID=112525 RepID=A0AAD8FPH2_BIOPF|nr:dopamine receptor 2 [Biomphalaria pfeifferi]